MSNQIVLVEGKKVVFRLDADKIKDMKIIAVKRDTTLNNLIVEGIDTCKREIQKTTGMNQMKQQIERRLQKNKPLLIKYLINNETLN